MSRDTQPMMGEPVSDDEVKRRKALLATFYAERTLPPLYRLATMSGPIGWGTLDDPRARSRYVFEKDNALSLPRSEVHTFESGNAGDITRALWNNNFGTLLQPSEGSRTVRVSVADSSWDGNVIAATADGWMVSVDTEDHALLILSAGSVPEVISLIEIDIDALAREQLS